MRAVEDTPIEREISWLQRLPRRGPVARETFLIDSCRGKRVIHVGFVDYPLLEARIACDQWLHVALADVAHSIVGIDSDERGVEHARRGGFEAYAVDASSPEAVAELKLEPADVVLAGEVIEHVDAPGPFLRAMLCLCTPRGRLITTTPNAYRALNFLVPLSGNELIHPDHVAWHSPSTLSTLLRSSGWELEEMLYYQNPPDPLTLGGGVRPALRRVVANAVRRLVTSRRLPYWCDGLIAVARPAS